VRFASAVSTERDPVRAAEEVSSSVLRGLGGGKPDLAVFFLTPHHRARDLQAATALREALGKGAKAFLGCTGAGILADGRELEDTPALAVLAGILPGASLRTFHVGQEDLEAGDAWISGLQTAPDAKPSFVLLPDPFSIDADRLLKALDESHPGAVKVGGVASGAGAPGEHGLFVGEEVHREGAVGLVITGSAEIRPLVSQGCRPIGPRFVITKGERNVIRELAGKPALAAIREVLAGLKGRDRELASTALLLGRVVDEAKGEFHRGDFLIRGLVGADEATGAVAVGDMIRRGQTVQLQVRDGLTADEDLRALLSHRGAELQAHPPAGALMFSCNGRGTSMYGDADHDSRVLREALPGLPLGGFFCNGEVGPVGGRTFLHGFTSSVGFLTAR